jgi:hypothetical protein
MSTEMTHPKYRISRVLLGELRTMTGPDGVLIPVKDVRVILENGAIHARTFLSFGLSEERVIGAWEREHDKFLKLDPNHP